MADNTRKNYIVDTEKAYGDITGSYEELVDMGVEYLYRVLQIASTLDTDIVLKFSNTAPAELNVPAGWQIPLPEFWHDGVIEIKHAGSAPTEGILKTISWRAE